MKRKIASKRNYKNILFIMGIILIIYKIIINPQDTISNARDGLLTWFNILIPSLFPFMILTDILISSNYIDFLGKILDPIMKTFFGISGKGAFPLVMSSISGYPIGAKLTAGLRKQKSLSSLEANRLIAFASTSGPLFIIGSVSIGMLNTNKISGLLLLPHYLSTLTIGMYFRFYKPFKVSSIKERSLLNKPYLDQDKAFSIGQVINASVRKSLGSILLIGGFVVFYFVIIDIVLNLRIVNIIISSLSQVFLIDESALRAILAGFIEITKGCQAVSSLSIDFLKKIMILNFVIGWGGLSIHSQALSFIYETDINAKIYIRSKFIHGLISSLYTYILYKSIYTNISIPSFSLPFVIHQDFNIGNWINILMLHLKLSLITILNLSIILFILNILVNKNKEA